MLRLELIYVSKKKKPQWISIAKLEQKYVCMHHNIKIKKSHLSVIYAS